MLKVRDAVKEDLQRIMEIYRHAQDYMIETGNPTQWGHFNPTQETIEEDIAVGRCKALYDEDGIHGVFALFETPEPCYARIDNGQWLNDDPYITIHRVAGDGQAHGVFSTILEYCGNVSKNIRIDTHNDNLTMQHLIEKNGFTKCGIIYLAGGSPRIAYQRCEA